MAGEPGGAALAGSLADDGTGIGDHNGTVVEIWLFPILICLYLIVPVVLRRSYTGRRKLVLHALEFEQTAAEDAPLTPVSLKMAMEQRKQKSGKKVGIVGFSDGEGGSGRKSPSSPRDNGMMMRSRKTTLESLQPPRVSHAMAICLDLHMCSAWRGWTRLKFTNSDHRIPRCGSAEELGEALSASSEAELLGGVFDTPTANGSSKKNGSSESPEQANGKGGSGGFSTFEVEDGESSSPPSARGACRAPPTSILQAESARERCSTAC